MTTPRRAELRALVKLALPLCATHVGIQLMAFVDTAVVGRLGAVPLAGVGLANLVFFTLFIIGLGTMMGLDPLISQALGAKDATRARQLFWQGVYLAGLVTLALAPPMILAPLLFEPFGIEPDVAEIARAYGWVRVLSVFPALLYSGTRSYLQALGITRPLVIATIVANVVNLGADLLFVFGGGVLPEWAGPLRAFPAMGAVGAAWATVICVIVQWLLLLAAARAARRAVGGVDVRAVHWPTLRAAVRVGSPIGFQLCAEVGIFALVALLAGRLGANALAAHQISLTLSSMSFMVAVGLGAASAVRVGHAIGARDAPGTRSAGLIAFAVGGGFMATSGLLFVLAPAPLAELLTDDPALIAASIPLLIVAALFQVSDGLQAVGAGVLRGAGDTRFAFLANVAGHWLIGLPVALVCGLWLDLGVVGLWIGLAVGLSAVAAALFVRFFRLSSKPIAPLERRG